jgi:hypothetical protein
LAKAESTVKNLSIALTGLSIETEETIERVLILTGQLKKISLSLIIAKEKEVIMTPKNEYIIYRLITS